ncbi:hypothetical protein EHO59_07590 [Leptospira semungkisensis]|uniref:Type IV secretion protein Rhs n=1 Tax=Leptospira semungkisensis TaxID=2484985 RepID=A0A4R9GAJ7_9LEPT|nr:RHS repeat-associated core domain-containing protein [Leptospira semungkisensis]TGK07947.1 hypothetical protein EHO59_07590 [Leptospira semungkisensis]
MKRKSTGILLLITCYFIFSGFSIRSLFQSITGSLVPQDLPQLRATPVGSLATSVEIVLPPGTKGIIPQLSLSYSSDGTNGLVGVGWNLEGIHSISRDPSFGVNYDGSDDFISSQAGQLLDVSGNRTTFHSRKESWIKYVPQGICGDGPCSWLATDRDGTQYTFGSTSDSRIEALGKNGSIRTWALSQVRDPFGNGYNITYIEDSTNGEYYPNQISYQNRTVQFLYEDRTDFSPNYMYGALVQTTKRLEEIRVTVDGSVIRKYGLEYSTGNMSERSLLVSLNRSESNAFGSEDYNDLNFQYGNQNFSLQSVADINLNTTISNLNLFVPSGLLLYANFLFQNPLPTQATATEKRMADYLQYAMHMPIPERDSCNYGPAACLCAAYAPCWGGNQGFFENLVSLCLDYNNWGGPTYCSAGIDSGLTNWMSMDLDGDGIQDFASVVGSETNNSIQLRAWTIKNGSMDSSTSFLSPAIPLHYNTFSQPVDLDGDGRTDFAYENNGKLNVIYSKSSSFSNATSFSNVLIPAANRNMTVFAPYSYFFEYSSTNTKRMAADKAPADWFADMNADGLTDFIHYDGSKFNIYLNQKGSFANAIQVSGTSNYFINDFLDMNADGKSEYVRLEQYSENASYTALSNQLDDLNSQAQTITNSYNTENDILNSILNSGTSSVSTSDFNSVIDYYLQGCTYYIASLSLGYSIDDIVLVPNSSGVNVACLNTDNNYIDITQLQAALSGTAIPVSNTLANDLQLVYANQIGPINTQASDIQSQLNTINASSNGTIRYRLNVTYFNLTNKTSLTQQYDLGTSADRLQSFFGDVNSDGLPDFITFVGTKLKVSLNTGNSFGNQVSSDLNATDGKNITQFNFADVNSDGMDDLIVYNKESQNVESYLSDGTGILSLNNSYGFGPFALAEQTTNGVYKADIGKLMIQDANGDGSPDALLVKLWMDKTQGHTLVRSTNLRNFGEDDLITVSNGVQSATAAYSPKHLHPGAIAAGTGDYPNIVDSSPGFLVTSLNANLGSGITSGETFQYSNSRFYAGVRGIVRSLGFADFTEKDSGTNFYTITEFFQIDYRLAGISSSERSYNASGNLIQETIQSGFQYPNPFGTELTIPTSVQSVSYHNGVIELSKNTDIGYDSFGFPLTQAETSGSHSIQTNITYSHDTTQWRIGRTTRMQKIVDGGLSQDQSISYSGDVVDSLTQFAGTNVEQTSTFTYDPTGNPVSITNALGATTTLAYDSDIHTFPVQTTNALGHVTKSTYDTALGLEVSKTDPNGATTSKTYDACSRLLTVTYPGNSDYNEAYEYKNSGRYNLADLSSNESITKTIRDTTSGIQTKITQYTDPYDNVIRMVSDTATSGISLIEDTTYDYAKNQITQKSQPYFSNLSPVFTTYQYNDPDLRPTGNTVPDPLGNIITAISYDGLTTTKNIQYPDGKTKVLIETKNELGQIISQSQNGKTIATSYASNGQPASILDPAGRSVTFTYDIAGRKKSVNDQNSGTVSFNYDALGQITKQTDARGKSLNFTYDPIGRITNTNPSGGDGPIQYSYDAPEISNSIGRLTKTIDAAGMTEFAYNAQGKATSQRKSIDGMKLDFQIEYDSLGRGTALTYPDGSKVHNTYSINGNLETVTMDTADGKSTGAEVAKYEGPIFVDGTPVFRKTMGNGVVTDIAINTINYRISQLTAKKANGTFLTNTSYKFDGVGNITTTTDNIRSDRSQTFTYDTDDRITQAVGSYGTEKYVYGNDGNLLQKGNFTYTYGNSSHANAVTRVYSSTTGAIDYSYDAAGNMVSRNGDTLIYDSYGKMIEYNPTKGEPIKYTYNAAGNRFKSFDQKSNTATYYMDDLYEIVNPPGQKATHTMYIKGFQGEILTQITQTDHGNGKGRHAALANDKLSFFVPWLDTLGFCKDKAIDCGQYWKNRIKSPITRFFMYSKYFQNGIPTAYLRAAYILFLLGLLYLAYPFLLKGNVILERAKLSGLASPALLLSFFGVFTLQDCNGILNRNSHANAPWFVLQNQSTSEDTPFITQANPGSGEINGSGAPVDGAYFYGLDHLGSTTMLTDGVGNQVAGPGQSGVSFVSYKPYGEINFKESTGPDIFRYKYTGEILDSETGLYYYKSRYYDAFLGRFAEADNRFDSGINGLNRYMYVGGNPLNRVDPNGHSWLSGALGKAGNWLQKATFINSIRANKLNFGANTINFNSLGNRLQSATYVSSKRWASFGYTTSLLAASIAGSVLGGIIGTAAGFLIGGAIGGPFGAIVGSAVGAVAGAAYGAFQGKKILKYTHLHFAKIDVKIFIKEDISISCGSRSDGPVPHCNVDMSPPIFMLQFGSNTGLPLLNRITIAFGAAACYPPEGKGGDEEDGDDRQHTEGLDCP